MIEFKDVHKTYPDGTKAIANLNLTVKEGELLALIGPSGCGKTTTMKMINRLVEPTSGEILVHNKRLKDYKIHELRWNIGYVLQEIALFPHMTIEENIAIVPEMKKWKKQDVQSRAKELLEMVGMDPNTYLQRKPNELSGGQQQRIGVIRALAADPDIILMDEPFSALDPISRESLQKDIRKLQQKIKKTIVFVTHDIDEATAIGDRVCLMKDGEIVQVDTPQALILHPKNDFVKSFIGDKKSPWQTAVDIFASQDPARTLTVTQFEEGAFDREGLYILIDDQSMFLGAVKNGRQTAIPHLNNDMTVLEASKQFQNTGETLLPVVKQEKLLGTLTTEDILHYLTNRTEVENGVVKQ